MLWWLTSWIPKNENPEPVLIKKKKKTCVGRKVKIKDVTVNVDFCLKVIPTYIKEEADYVRVLNNNILLFMYYNYINNYIYKLYVYYINWLQLVGIT